MASIAVVRDLSMFHETRWETFRESRNPVTDKRADKSENSTFLRRQ